jgi:DNA-binding response OmpR family regulator/HPt (histidine-containing phosphotransfer) domain-containing protein
MAGSTNAQTPDDIFRETRQRFIAAFPTQCDSLSTIAREGDAAGYTTARHTVHRLAGLAGMLGFGRVGEQAAQIEDLLRQPTPIDGPTLLVAIETLRSAFVADLSEPDVSPASPRHDAPASFTVVVVEDDADQRAIVAEQLRRIGHVPIEVASGDRVLEVARESRPDAILLDIDLPGLNGHAVCLQLKADPDVGDTPIIFVSARRGLDDRLAGLALGADDFLVKPVDANELMLRVQRLNGRRRASPTLTRSRDELPFDAFCAVARDELLRYPAALALLRAAADGRDELAAAVRGEVRRRDLLGKYDRTHLVLLFPEMDARTARERMTDIIQMLTERGAPAMHAGVAESPAAGARTVDALLEEADGALAAARYRNVPVAQQSDEQAAPPKAAQAAATTIVLGDDDPDISRIVDAHLQTAGYRTVLTFDGARALEAVKAERPAVLVLDLMMPKLTGFDVLARLREMTDRPRVIVLSARGREEDVMRAFDLGADDYMAKPFSPQELLARITRLLR